MLFIRVEFYVGFRALVFELSIRDSFRTQKVAVTFLEIQMGDS